MQAVEVVPKVPKHLLTRTSNFGTYLSGGGRNLLYKNIFLVYQCLGRGLRPFAAMPEKPAEGFCGGGIAERDDAHPLGFAN